MKKRCEVTLVIYELSIHEFVSLFSWKREDELKNKLRAIQKRSKFKLGSTFGGSLNNSNILVSLKNQMFLSTTSPKLRTKLFLVQNFRLFLKGLIYSPRVSPAMICVAWTWTWPWTGRGREGVVRSQSLLFLTLALYPLLIFIREKKQATDCLLKVIYKLECNQSRIANSVKNHQSRT